MINYAPLPYVTAGLNVKPQKDRQKQRKQYRKKPLPADGDELSYAEMTEGEDPGDMLVPKQKYQMTEQRMSDGRQKWDH